MPFNIIVSSPSKVASLIQTMVIVSHHLSISNLLNIDGLFTVKFYIKTLLFFQCEFLDNSGTLANLFYLKDNHVDAFRMIDCVIFSTPVLRDVLKDIISHEDYS